MPDSAGRFSASGAADLELEGVVLPTAWEDAGAVLSVSLLTFDEREFAIDPAVARKFDLLRLIRKHVRLSAKVRSNRVVTVTRLSVVDDPGIDPATGVPRSTASESR